MIFSSIAKLHNWLTKLSMYRMPIPRMVLVSSRFLEDLRDHMRYTNPIDLNGITEFAYLGHLIHLIKV